MFEKSTLELGSRGHLKVLNDTKLILNYLGGIHANLGSIWYHLEPSHVPNSKTSFFVGTFLPFLIARRL